MIVGLLWRGQGQGSANSVFVVKQNEYISANFSLSFNTNTTSTDIVDNLRLRILLSLNREALQSLTWKEIVFSTNVNGKNPSLLLTGFISDYQRGTTQTGTVEAVKFTNDGLVLTLISGSFTYSVPSGCTPVWRIQIRL